MIFTLLTKIARCVNLLPPQDDVAFLKTAHRIYEKYQRFPEALSLAIRLNDSELIHRDFHAPGNPYGYTSLNQRLLTKSCVDR